MQQKKFLISLVLCAWSASALEKTYVKRMDSEDFVEAGAKLIYPDEMAFGVGANWGDRAQLWLQNEKGIAFDLRAKVFKSSVWPEVFVGLNRYAKPNTGNRTEFYTALQKQMGIYHAGLSASMPMNPLDYKVGAGAGVLIRDHIGLSYEAIYTRRDVNHQLFGDYSSDIFNVGLGFVYQPQESEKLDAIFSATVRLPLKLLALKKSALEAPSAPKESPSVDAYVSKIAELEKRIQALEAAKSLKSEVPVAEPAHTAQAPVPKPVKIWSLDSLQGLEDDAYRALMKPELREDFAEMPGASDFIKHLRTSPVVSQGLRSAADQLGGESKDSDPKAPVLPMEEALIKAITVSSSAGDSALKVLAKPLDATPGLLPYVVNSNFTAPSLRQGAAKLYAADPVASKLPQLKSWLEDRDAKVRRSAVKGLGKAMDLGSAQALKQLSQTDPSESVREEAKSALKRIVGGLMGESTEVKASAAVHADKPSPSIQEEPKSKKKHKKKKSKKKSSKYELSGDRKLPKSEVFPSKAGKESTQTPKFEPITGHELEDPKPM